MIFICVLLHSSPSLSQLPTEVQKAEQVDLTEVWSWSYILEFVETGNGGKKNGGNAGCLKVDVSKNFGIKEIHTWVYL